MKDEKNEPIHEIPNEKKSVYLQFLKAILIGGMASGSRPYHEEEAYMKELPLELSMAIKSLQKKQGAFFVAKRRYAAVGDKALRQSYDGENVLGSGSLYTKLRIHKYCEDLSKVDELINYMKNILDLPDNGLSTGAVSAHASAEEAASLQLKYIKQAANDLFSSVLSGCRGVEKSIVDRCFLRLAGAFQEKLMSLSEQDDIESVIIETIAFIEMIPTLYRLKMGETLSYAEYLRSMTMLHQAIMNRLPLDQPLINREDNFYPKMLGINLDSASAHSPLFIGKTLVANSAREAKNRSLALFMDYIEHEFLPAFSLPAFTLPSANPREPGENGYYKWFSRKPVDSHDSFALIGRTTETKYDISLKELEEVIKKIELWVNLPPHPKMLVVDVTIMTPDACDPILKAVMKMRSQMRDLSHFDILVVRSEQKHHSLGLGKFSAGSSYLITSDMERQKKFDDEALKPRTPDQLLATFYRENMSVEARELVEEICRQASLLAAEINASTPNAAFTAGPVIGIEHQHFKLIANDSREGTSFGFLQKTQTSWRSGQKRIDPGFSFPKDTMSYDELESRHARMHDIAKLEHQIKMSLSDPTGSEPDELETDFEAKNPRV